MDEDEIKYKVDKHHEKQNFDQIDQYQREYQETQEKQLVKQVRFPKKELYLLALIVCISSVKASLYLLTSDMVVTRVAWRQLMVSLSYVFIAISDRSQYKNLNLVSTHLKQFVIACLAQAVFVVSLSISIQYIQISISLMCYNSSILLYGIYKVVTLKTKNKLEITGVIIGFLIMGVVLEIEGGKQPNYLLGNILAFVGAFSSIIYGKNFIVIQNDLPNSYLLAMTRFITGITLLIFGQMYDDNLTGFFTPNSFLLLIINVLTTSLLYNYLQTRIRSVIDPFIEKAGSFFEPIPGTIFALILQQQENPSIYIWICMFIFIFSLILVQKGRMEEEAEEISMEETKFDLMRQDTLIEEIPFRRSMFKSIKRGTIYKSMSFDINMEN